MVPWKRAFNDYSSLSECACMYIDMHGPQTRRKGLRSHNNNLDHSYIIVAIWFIDQTSRAYMHGSRLKTTQELGQNNIPCIIILYRGGGRNGGFLHAYANAPISYSQIRSLTKISNLSDDMRSPQVQFALQTAQMNDIASN